MLSYLLILFLFLQNGIFPVEEEYLVKQFTVDDGLPVNSVNTILQDDDGFLWFSTLDGLARFDGYEFKIFNSGNTNGFYSNRVGGMMKTSSNELWLIHPDGSITRKTGAKFINYSEINGDFSGTAERLSESPTGDLWVSTSNGLFRFDYKTESFQEQVAPLLQTNTWAIHATYNNRVFALNENGLIRWQNQEARILLESENFPIPAGDVLHIKQFGDGEIWIAGGGGIFRYSLKEQHIDFTFRTADPESTVWNLHQAENRQIIVNTSEGFYSLDTENLQITEIAPDISTATDRINLVFRGANGEEILLGDNEVLINGKQVFEAEEIQSGFVDNEGSLWISTLRDGVYQIRKSDFSNITEEQIPEFENIYPIIESSVGAIWAGSFTNGIYRITGETVTNWNTENSNLSGDLCRFLFEDSEGSIYASLWGQGLWRFRDNNWIRVNIGESAETNTTVEAMHRDSRNRLLIGNTGPLLVNQNGTFSLFDNSRDDELQGVRVIRESSNGTLFMGTNGNGFTIAKGDEVVNYTTRNSDLTSDFIRDIYIQSPDTLWLATENLGLNRLILDKNQKLASVESITERDGLIKNSLHRIIKTPDNQLWISSNGGIMRISEDELNNFADGKLNNLSILVFTEDDGMANREANGGVQTAGLLSADQKLWFPNQKGITIIDPSSYSDRTSPHLPSPIIEQISVVNSTIQSENLAEIVIPGNQRNMRISFSLPNFLSPDRMQFRYKLEGVNQDWEDATAGREAILTNIPPGTHSFHVSAYQAGNSEIARQASILITVPPTFYETTWFYFLIAGVGLLILVGAIKYRTRVLEARERKLQERVDLQTEELQKAAEQKSRFFSGITHELKTPLSLISGPLEDILDRPEKIPAATIHKLRMMNRNNHRLQNLVDQILDVTKLNSDALKLTFKPVNIVDFTKQIVGQFQSKLDQKNIHVHLDSDSINEKIYIDTDAWERIMINLLSNAIRFSTRNSSIQMCITDLKNRIRISVKDEGIGIDEKNAHKVFDYLYQAEGAYSAEGTGIGLYLVKGLVEHMKGEINLISKKGEGAEFIITLQKGISHFSDSDKVIHFHSGTPTTTEIAATTVAEPTVNQNINPEATVLVVEDNDDFRSYMQSILVEQYNVMTAEEGNSALKILEAEEADLIISDVMMPGMNGLEFVNTLRKKENYQHLPVILLSAKDQEMDMETGLSTGADIYLTKPIKSSLLLSQVTAVLRREKALKNNQFSTPEDDKIPFVKQVRTIIYRQLANPSLSVNMLADALFMSRRKLYNEWAKNNEVSLNDFIKKVRLDEAKILLRDQGFSVQETALAVGYSNTNYFSTSFKKEFGMSPSEII